MLRLALLLALAAAVTAATPAAAPPPAGVLVPGRSLGGIELGATKAEVERRWGRAYGVCRSCARETWYFNQYAFRPEGAGVELRAGRVAAVFTLHRPRAWRTNRGLQLGETAARVTSLYGALVRRECGGYSAYELRERRATTVLYVLDEQLWAFGLLRPDVPVCR